MSSDKIQLPDFLIADLYKSSLVDIGRAGSQIASAETVLKAQEAAASSQKQIEYLGKNKKAVAVLVNQPQVPFLPEPELLFLTNILKACSLTIEDIAIVNTAQTPATFQDLKEQLAPSHLLVYGLETAAIKLPFSIPHFQVQKFDNTAIVMAPTLAEINQQTPQSTDLKRQLWNALKRMFDI